MLIFYSVWDIPYISRQILGKKIVFKKKNKKEKSKNITQKKTRSLVKIWF